MALVTFAPVIYSQYKRKDGTYTVKIRMTFKRQSKFISTNITLRPEQLTRSLKIRDDSARVKVNTLVLRMEKSISEIDFFSLDTMSIDDVAKYVTRHQSGTFRLDFIEFGLLVVSEKNGKSGKNYRSALNAFVSFLGKDSIDISQVTSSLMRGFEKWLVQKHGEGSRAVSLYTSSIAFIHRQARLRYNNEEIGEQFIKNPFDFYRPPKQRKSQHRSKDAQLIREMIIRRKDLSRRERLGVDVYLLSFCLMGMNCPDLYECAFPDNGVLRYFRHKTTARREDKAEMRVRIDSRIMTIVEEYRDSKRARAFDFYHRYSAYENLGTAVNIGLRQFEERIGLGERLTLYSARHTWASLARNAAHISKDLVDDCLCHVDKDMKVADIYIRKDWNLFWEANAKVLDLFDWDGL